MAKRSAKPEAAQWPFPAKGSPAWKAAQGNETKTTMAGTAASLHSKASAGAPNPDWTRDELILALDLYFREPAARGSKTHPECIKLSEALNSLPIHQGQAHGVTFRNANGVGMKLSNFLKYDPTYKGVGLTSGSRLEEEVWTTFSGDHTRLHQAAEAILAGAVELSENGISVPDDDDDEEAEEGRILTAIHRRRERQPGLARKKKQQALDKTGALKCEVCNFDFAVRYGKLGEGFAECHHGRPISTLKAGDKTKLSELHIVCANCHRMLHRERPWLSVEQLRGRYTKAGT
jgi:5-methylcytosine-specific restriction protein A